MIPAFQAYMQKTNKTVDNKQYLEILYTKLAAGNLDQQELNWLREYFDTGNPDHLLELIRAELQLADDLSAENPAETAVFSRVYAHIESARLTEFAAKRRPVRLWSKAATMAAAIAMIATGVYFYTYRNVPIVVRTASNAAGISPGRNAATLTLSNGKKIVLSDAVNGELAKEAGVNITKTADGQLVYEIFGSGDGSENSMNTLSTARGETYVLSMPDGTKVWLNAATTIKYPANFASLSERRVQLEGEAYFEVARDKSHPFLVESATQQVKVLGTHFNVNTYRDEPSVKTTLLEGAVRINDSTMLKPGEQSVLLPSGRFSVQQVNADKFVAWKNGKFVFERERIEGVMRKLARWYNVEVEYKGRIADKTFSGTISRFENISKILDKITYTQNVKFKIEGRRIIVMP